MAIFPVLIRVESPALGDVLQIIHKFPGIIDFKIMFDEVPAPRGGPRKRVNGNGADHPEPGPSTSTLIIAALSEHGPLHLKQLASLLPDATKASISTALSEMKNAGITEARGMGVHALTADALAKMGAKAKDAVLAMPKPDNKGQGADIVLSRLSQGPAKRSELAALLVDNNLAASSIQTVLNKLIERQLVETPERAMYQLKAAPEAEPAAAKGSRAAVIDYFKTHTGDVTRAELVKALPAMSGRAVDGHLIRLKDQKIIETPSKGAYRFTKDAAKKLQASASKE